MKKVYLSGKISGLDIEEAKKNFNLAEKRIKDRYGECEVISPFCIPSIMPTWGDYIISDLMLLKQCDAIAMLPNWEESQGAHVERAFAEGLGIDIIELEDESLALLFKGVVEKAIKLEEEDRNQDKFFEWYEQCPNNLSKWYKKMLVTTAYGIDTPKTITIPVPRNVVLSYVNNEHFENIDRWVAEVAQVIRMEFKNDVFIKNGDYSNKYEFDASCHLSCPFLNEDLKEHIGKIMYFSLLHDTGGIIELNIREYIEPREGTPKIYGGMPLRPELRVFYDFDKHEYLYDVNYWDWDYCSEFICSLQGNGLVKGDGEIYREAYEPLCNELARYKAKFTPIIENALRNVQGMTGIWSVDFLFEGDKCYLIDMAIGRMSAYWDENKVK